MRKSMSHSLYHVKNTPFSQIPHFLLGKITPFFFLENTDIPYLHFLGMRMVSESSESAGTGGGDLHVTTHHRSTSPHSFTRVLPVI